jgi:heme/copper-type cytochrome/quinol oxidase subunit 3
VADPAAPAEGGDMTGRIVGDVSALPEAGFGPRTVLWWGLLGFILIEGGGFALAAGAYLFLMSHTDPWPPHHPPPDLLWGSAFTLLIFVSEILNVITSRAARAQDERTVKLGLIAASAIGILLMVVRGFEFHALNVRWDANAYGSIVWALIFLHTTHVITDLADTIGLTVFSFTHEVDTNRFSDVADNCLYWHFVLVAWLPIYALVYLVPRLAG